MDELLDAFYFNISPENGTKNRNVFQLGYPPLRIDLLTEIDGVYFDECRINGLELIIEGPKVNVTGYHDLLKNKLRSGPPGDIDDIENLK